MPNAVYQTGFVLLQDCPVFGPNSPLYRRNGIVPSPILLKIPRTARRKLVHMLALFLSSCHLFVINMCHMSVALLEPTCTCISRTCLLHSILAVLLQTTGTSSLYLLYLTCAHRPVLLHVVVVFVLVVGGGVVLVVALVSVVSGVRGAVHYPQP
jgi:hypothetical protein